MRYQDKPIHRLLGTTSLTNIYKKDTPGQNMNVAKKIIKSIQEANDELNKKTPSEEDIMKKHGMSKTELDHHLAIGIKVEMEHTKNAAVAREIALDHINEKPDYYAKLKKMVEDVNEASIHSSYMKRGGSGMRAKAPNASDMASFGTYNVTVRHDQGEKSYKLKNMKDSRHAQNVALKIHRKDNPSHKISSASADKVEVKEQNIVEISKQLMGRYVQKAATSMASAAFGQGQASASLRAPSEKDVKTSSKRLSGIIRATHKMAKEETIHEETSASLKKMSDYHAKEAEYHDKHAMNKDHSEERRKGHALARSSHYSASENYLKASRADNDTHREYYIDKAEKHADAAEEREREHKLMEGVQVDELNQMTLSRYGSKARVQAMDKNNPKQKQRVIGTSRAYSKLSRGDFSEEVEQVDELKKSTMQSYLDKTVDPDLGMPKDTKKPAQRIKGIERASKKIISKVNEQQFLTIPDVKEKEHKRAAQQRQARRSYISSRNSEARRMYKEEAELKPHRVSVQLKHPAYEGITNKVVKVNATDTKHAEDIVATHYGRRGFKVHKVDYSKPHMEQFPASREEKAKEAEAKEDNKIKKIASAIKDATK